MAGFNPYGNNYVPYGMNNYNPYNNPGYQQNNNSTIQMNHYAFVNGIEGAKSFQMAPNQTIMLMDSDNPMCYMKTTNNIGQATLRYFKLIEVNENDLKQQPAAQPQGNANDYVLKADFETLSKRMDELSNKLEKSLKTDILMNKED